MTGRELMQFILNNEFEDFNIRVECYDLNGDFEYDKDTVSLNLKDFNNKE